MLKLDVSRFFSGVIVTVLGVIAIWYSSAARAGSFAVNEQSDSGLGTAYAGGAAQANDVSTIFFNPAGIALLDQGEFQLGGNNAALQAKFTNEGSHYTTEYTGERVRPKRREWR